MRKTSKGRFRRTVKRVATWCRVHRHRPIAEQHHKLSVMLRGHDAYFGITGNLRALHRLRQAVILVWRQWLNRRSSNASMDWGKFERLLKRYPLPRARVVHSVYKVTQRI